MLGWADWWAVSDRRGHIVGNDAGKTNIDVWVVDDWGFGGFEGDQERCDQTVMLLVQFGQILNHKLKDDQHELRLMYVPSLRALEALAYESERPEPAEPEAATPARALTARFCALLGLDMRRHRRPVGLSYHSI